VRRAADARPSLHAEVDIDPGLVVGVNRALLERLVSPVVEIAVRHARELVVVSATAGADGARLLVADDGPGVRSDLRDTVFEAGWPRPPEGRCTSTGTATETGPGSSSTRPGADRRGVARLLPGRRDPPHRL
jgi:K+-sensing histidine kinase KdpD